MAVIQKIRDNSALTLIVVGGAILAFVLTDYFNSNVGGRTDENIVGSFNGDDIAISEFTTVRDQLVFLKNSGESFNNLNDFQQGQSSNQAWTSILRDKFILSEIEDLGLTIPQGEIENMLVDNPNGLIVNYIYGGSDTYMQNRNNITLDNFSQYAYMAKMDRQGQVLGRMKLGNNAFWMKDFFVEYELKNKYQRLIENSFYATTSLAKNKYIATNTTKDVKVGYVRYSTITDSLAKPSDEEIEAAYEKLKHKFVEKENTRKIVFARFDLEPSDKDRNQVFSTVKSLQNALVEGEADDELFIKNETESRVDFSYYKKGDYPVKVGGLDTVAFAAKVGDVVGPFRNPTNTQFAIAKLLDKRMLSDSVKINMLMLSQKYVMERAGIDGQNAQPEQSDILKFQNLYQSIADSLVKVANRKGLAGISKEFWADSTSYAKAGDAGMVPLSINYFGKDFVDSALVSKNGDAKLVKIPVGNGNTALTIIHFEKFGPKFLKAKIGSIVKNVTPGNETLDNYLSMANQVAFSLKEGNNISTLKDSLNYVVDSSVVKGSTYNLRGLQDSRKVVKWAFDASLNEPSNVFTTPTAYLVAFVKEENNSGYTPLSDQSVKYQCETYARKEKQKEIILKNFPSVTAENISEFPTLYKGGQVKVAQNVNVDRGISEFANEPKVKGAIAGLKAGTASEPIKGENGIYVVAVSNSKAAEITEDTNFDAEKNQLNGESRRNSSLVLDEYINEKAEVTDNRKVLQ